MTNPPPDTRFHDAWIEFIRALRTLINGSISDRPRYTDQWLQWSNATLTAAEDAATANALQGAYNASEADRQAADLLLMELLGFPQAVNVASQTEPTGERSAAARQGLLGIGKTIINSSKDVLGHFLDDNPKVKSIMTVLGEVPDVFGIR
jgi:hypothetical protein